VSQVLGAYDNHTCHEDCGERDCGGDVSDCSDQNHEPKWKREPGEAVLLHSKVIQLHFASMKHIQSVKGGL
jgi:hypothetical protein